MTAVEIWTPAGTASVTGEGYAPAGRIDAAPEVRALVADLALHCGSCVHRDRVTRRRACRARRATRWRWRWTCSGCARAWSCRPCAGRTDRRARNRSTRACCGRPRWRRSVARQRRSGARAATAALDCPPSASRALQAAHAMADRGLRVHCRGRAVPQCTRIRCAMRATCGCSARLALPDPPRDGSRRQPSRLAAARRSRLRC